MPKKNKSGFKWVKATITDGGCHITYRLDDPKVKVDGRTDIDDDVEGWSDEDLRRIICQMIELGEKFASMIQIN